ncbi:Protein-L-isoaspartate O-methyltransferase [Imhoffiella purpurea]|uniref:Protein-L-isoaspartate O-methyltransferase n=2 Tax=Imhoffiella purpurea TaxID=1249627 RepID=W9VI98_9GAMM|nr:Protein-L-isoaspartate O-methyltransferase [Imhoffiella purpurea]
MIHQQIRPWGVLDERVLETMAEIPRESFVPDAYRGLAYADIEVPIGIDNCMLAPKVVGRLLQALAVKPGDKTLEIGTGSGYLSACLSRLGARVVSLEIDPVLANAARARLERLEFARIEVREADGLAGPVQGGPFEAIAVTGSMPTDAALGMLRDQLAVGGRLFCVIGEEPAMRAILVTRTSQTGFRQQALFETSLPSLLNVVEPAGFEF